MQFRTRLFSILAGVALCATAIASYMWQPITAGLADWGLQTYFFHCRDCSFTVEEAFWRDGLLVFKSPHLNSLPGASSPIEVNAEEFHIAFHPHVWEGRLTVELGVIAPTIEFTANHDQPLDPWQLLSEDEGAFPVETSIQVTNGTLQFNDPSAKRTSQFAFSGFSVPIGGSYTLASSNKGFVRCDYEGNDWTLTFDSLDVGNIFHAAKAHGLAPPHTQILQGTLSGTVDIDWDKEGIPDISGCLALRECTFSNAHGDMHGHIPEATLALNDSSLAGEFILSKGAYLEYTQEGKPPLALSHLEGTVSMPSYDRCFVKVTGDCAHHGNSYALNMDGHIKVSAQEKGSCEFEIALNDNEHPPVRACVSSMREDYGRSNATLEVHNIGADEWELLMIVLGTQDIGLEPYTIKNGLIDALIVLGLENFKIQTIDIEEFRAKNLAFDLDLLDTSIQIDHAKGSLSLDLSKPNVLESLQASFGIEGGMVDFPALNKQHWHLSNLVTELAIENGTFKKSFVQADFMGMRGLIEVDWSSDTALKMNFQGNVSDLAALASSNVQKGIVDKFHDDKLAIIADVSRIKSGLNVEGTINIADPHTKSAEAIQMGFMLQKTSANSSLLRPVVMMFTKQLGREVIHAVVKQATHAKEEPATEWLKEELRIAGFALTNGWFSANALPTEKYIEPFFFKDGQMSVSGTADFRGHFDCDGLAVEYQTDNLTLENDDLAFKVGAINSNHPAKHYFDFKHDTDHGTVPVTSGVYFEKNSDLLFVDVKGDMLLQDKTIHIPAIETKCNNVLFAGSIDVDYSSPLKKVFDVDIKTHTMDGSYRNVSDLLSHFNEHTSLIELPLEGAVSLHAPGGQFHFAFRPTGCDVEATIHGTMDNGTLETPLEGIALQDIHLNFDYDHKADRLNVHKLSGNLKALNTADVPLLIMHDSYIHFLNTKDGIAAYNLSFSNLSREIIRLAGTTSKGTNDDESAEQLIFNIDRKLSHLNNKHPQEIGLVTSNGDVDALKLTWDCDLETCFTDLQEIGYAILLRYAPALAKQWHGLGIPSGSAQVAMNYDRSSSLLNFDIKGKGIHVGAYAYENFVFSGAKRKNIWSVEQLQMDKISVAADIHPQDDGYKVNFLGLRYGDLLLMGLEGFYSKASAVFDGNINLLEMDFGKLGQWNSFKELVADFHPKGDMRGSGSLKVIMDDEWPPKVAVNLKTSLRNCDLRGLNFEDADNVCCEFTLHEKLVLKNCQTGFKCLHSGCSQGLFNIDTTTYDFKKEEMTLNGLNFQTHADNLDWIATHLANVFPEAFTPKIADIIRHIKDDDILQGSLNLRISDDSSFLAMKLPEGKYRFGEKDHEVNNFSLEWDKKDLNIVSQYRFQNTLYWINAKSTAPDIDAGDIFVSATPPDPLHPYNKNDSICISWYMHPQHGMVVEKAYGKLPGVYVNLMRDRLYPMNPHSWHLDGEILLDPLKGQHIIPPDIVDALNSWNISRDYDLKGKWIFMLEAPHDGDLYFEGSLTAQEAILKGYVVGNVSANLNCSPTRIDVNELVFNDPAGMLMIPTASMVKENDETWVVYVPQIVGQNFRPCLLRDTTSAQGPIKPLIIPRFQVDNVVCRANDLATMTGTGFLDFNNSSKRPLHNPLLAIPAEIISRIGLNLDVLNPVSGTIFFNIDDYKVKLTKFKDVYSEGKLSKFYLPHNNYTSYVDFDKNVHVQVRMKQYNLLFKLAELITVTIHGTLQKPVYTLQKQ